MCRQERGGGGGGGTVLVDLSFHIYLALFVDAITAEQIEN